MDLITVLAGQLGVESAQAQALAGSVIGGVQRAVADREDDRAAEEMSEAIPELSAWKDQASSLLGGDEGGDEGGGIGGLLGGALGGGAAGILGAVAGAVGGQQGKDVAAVVAVLDKLGVDSSKASLVAPTILQFLKERVSSGLLEKILAAAPLLSMVGGSRLHLDV